MAPIIIIGTYVAAARMRVRGFLNYYYSWDFYVIVIAQQPRIIMASKRFEDKDRLLP